MLFYVQMRWKIEPPLTLDDFWELEKQEIDVALQTIKEGKVRGLYKVAPAKSDRHSRNGFH